MKKIYTFEEFVEYGLLNSYNIVNGYPWSFEFYGIPVTHENDDYYIISTNRVQYHFKRGGLLIIKDKQDDNCNIPLVDDPLKIVRSA